jgi:Calcium-dependent channel, 7TM region, putative phosphate
LEDPTKIVSALADNLPKKSTYFVQILLVKTFLNLGLELLKITPLFIAGVRSKVGPRLTEKERNSIWMGLRPLAAPGEFAFSDVTSSAILYYMVLFGKELNCKGLYHYNV